MRWLGRFLLSAVFTLSLAFNAAPAQAQSVPFAFLIQDGWTKLFQNQHVRQDQALTSWAARSTFYWVVNGQKAGLAGNALIHAWTRAVADPYFAPLGSLAGVVTLDFGGFRGHLTVFDTPSGIHTTIGIITDSDVVDTTVTGAWVYATGGTVIGGTDADMVVAGVVHFGQPGAIGTVGVAVTPYFPSYPYPPIAMDSAPFVTTQVSPSVAVGSFYGAAQGPLRTYRRSDPEWTGFRDDLGLLIMSVAGGNYAVVACSDLGDRPADAYLQQCTVSGTGPLLGRLTGSSAFVGSTWLFNWTLFLAP